MTSMTNKKAEAIILPKSIRKYIRLHKQKIRRTIIGFSKQRDEIKKLYDKWLKKETIKTAKRTVNKLGKRKK